MIKSLIFDLTDMKHLDISAITSGLQFGQSLLQHRRIKPLNY